MVRSLVNPAWPLGFEDVVDPKWSSTDAVTYLEPNTTSTQGRFATPDTAVLDLAGDLDLRVNLALDDWTPASVAALVSKWNPTGNQRSYQFYVRSDGALLFLYSSTGADTVSTASTAAVPFANGQRASVRVTLDADNGSGSRVVTFYTSTDDEVTWDILGSPVTVATPAVIFNGTSEIAIGGRAGAAQSVDGRIYTAEIRNGINGTIVARPDFSAQAGGTTSFVDDYGLTWTQADGATIFQEDVVTTGIATDQKRSGNQSCKFTCLIPPGEFTAWTGDDADPKAVTAVFSGQKLNSSFWVRTDRTDGVNVYFQHRWYNGTTLLSVAESSAVSVPANTWTKVDHESAAPSTVDGTQFGIRVDSLAVGESLWLDDWDAWREPVAWTPTTTQILDLDGVHHRTDSFRFELCDQDLEPIGELHPDHGSTPSISVDVSNNPSRRLSGLKLVLEEATDVNVLRDRLRVYMRLQNGAEFRLGTFLWADASHPERSWGPENHSELIDFSYILDQQSTRTYSWGRGASPIGVAMIFLCFRAGFELTDLYPMGREADRAFTEPVSWQPGTTWRQMLTDLCTIVGFASPWFDRNGRLHFDQAPDPAKDHPTIPAYGPNTRVIKDSVVFSDGMLSAPNEFAVFESGTGALRIGRYALPAKAPHSRQNRGFPLGMTETVQGLTSQAQADKSVRDLARAKGDAMEELQFTSTLDPRHDMWDVVPAFDKTWLETSHSMELRSGGTHRHTMKRVFYDVV